MNFGQWDIATWIYRAMAVLFALSAHEYAHAYVAYRLGDRYQKYAGRLTMNPLAHLDPFGTLMLLVASFGWAKPVMVNPQSFKNPRWGMVAVSLAGPGMNMILATLFILPFRLGFGQGIPPQYVDFISINFYINLGLAAFNLIPIPPLDGSKVLGGLLPAKYSYQFDRLEQWGPIILILLIATGTSQIIFSPIFNLLFRIVAGR